MAAAPDHLGGIFGHSTPTPPMLRLWLQLVRTTLNWSIEDAAEESGLEARVVVKLESSGEAQSEEDDDALCALASTYADAVFAAEAADKRPPEYRLRCSSHLMSYGNGLRGDWNPPLARRLRTRRAELQLTVADVATRTGGAIAASDLEDAEWTGVINDYEDVLRGLGAALDLPYLELRMLAERGEITEEDIEAWTAWRAERDATAYRRAK